MFQSGIPVVDISSFRLGRFGRHQVVRDIRLANEQIGFFVVTGHGVPAGLVRRMCAASRAFFDLPRQVKVKVGQSGNLPGGLMYFPMAAEALAASRGERTPGDLKESLDYGPGLLGDKWPATPAGLRQVWLDYYQAMSTLAGCLRRIFALAIGLDESFFEDKFDRHHSSLRVINYPEPNGDPLPDQMRAGAHSDYGFLTILRSEASAGGLQAMSRAGRWINVPVVPDGFVVNVGDALMRWTNDHWHSTLHRVANPPSGRRRGSRRQSIPFFHNPNKEAVIRCLDQFTGPKRPPAYDPITYQAYAKLKYQQAHGDTAG